MFNIKIFNPKGISTILANNFNKNSKEILVPNKDRQAYNPDELFTKVEIVAKGHEPEVLRSYHIFIDSVAKLMDLDLEVSTRNRPVFDRLSLNKSPFIYKKHQRQYEFRTYYKTFKFSKITGTTTDVVLAYIQHNTPVGVGLEISKYRCELLPEYLKAKLEKRN